MSGDDIWSRLGELSDDELGTLIVEAQHVIASDAGDAIEYLSMPVGVAAGAIAASLGEAGTRAEPQVVAGLVRDPARARALALAALQPIWHEPELGKLVAEAYGERRGMLAVDPELISAVSLLVLILKLKRVKIGKLDVSFYEIREGVLDQLRNLLRQ